MPSRPEAHMSHAQRVCVQGFCPCRQAAYSNIKCVSGHGRPHMNEDLRSTCVMVDAYAVRVFVRLANN